VALAVPAHGRRGVRSYWQARLETAHATEHDIHSQFMALRCLAAMRMTNDAVGHGASIQVARRFVRLTKRSVVLSIPGVQLMAARSAGCPSARPCRDPAVQHTRGSTWFSTVRDDGRPVVSTNGGACTQGLFVVCLPPLADATAAGNRSHALIALSLDVFGNIPGKTLVACDRTFAVLRRVVKLDLPKIKRHVFR
jgi:hypothetical protein